ncbi:MAG TPA: lysophospholipid acyltransferase family protein [Candidatus Acidoferrum sp.]|nr:lysophospholipid acyltransferase family protein [Candidatus Acidoferrum sp.]
MNFVYWLGWTFFRLIFATYFRWRPYNAERVPRAGAVILASNHASFLDPPIVGSPLKRPCSFLARDTLFRWRPARWLLTRWQAIPVDRTGSSPTGLRNILGALQQGRAVVLFPEGTRTRDGHLQPARSGIGLLVVKSGAPVVPVRVWGSMKAYGRDVKIPKPRQLILKYGEPMRFEALLAEAKTCPKDRLKQIYQEIADQIMQAIAKLEPKED